MTLRARAPRRKAAPPRRRSSGGEAIFSAAGARPSRSSLTIVAEAHHYLILDKPALLDVQASRPGRPSVAAWLEGRYGFAGLVHRLDFGTSGLIVCAKNREGAAALTELLQSGRLKRTYLAVVMGQNLPDRGELATPLDGKAARTRFRVLERFANSVLVEAELETGRKHQIRRHFAEAGHPLLGDHRHGRGGAKLLFGRPALHAHQLRIEGETFESPLPADLNGLLERLRERSSAPPASTATKT